MILKEYLSDIQKFTDVKLEHFRLENNSEEFISKFISDPELFFFQIVTGTSGLRTESVVI